MEGSWAKGRKKGKKKKEKKARCKVLTAVFGAVGLWGQVSTKTHARARANKQTRIRRPSL